MAGEAPVMRVIEIRTGNVVVYVYAEGAHIETPTGDGADIGPKGMAALIQAWRKMHPDEPAAGNA